MTPPLPPQLLSNGLLGRTQPHPIMRDLWGRMPVAGLPGNQGTAVAEKLASVRSSESSIFPVG